MKLKSRWPIAIATALWGVFLFWVIDEVGTGPHMVPIVFMSIAAFYCGTDADPYERREA